MVQVNYCLVKQNVGALIEDSPGDYDRYPDFKEVTGEVTFTPMTPAGQSFQLEGSDGEMYTVPITRIRGTIVEGKIWHEGEEGVPLFAGGDNANPSSVSYRVTYSRLLAGENPIQLNPIAFTAIPGATIDLTTVTPISNAPVSGVIKGDKGDKGDKGVKGDKGEKGDAGYAGVGSPEGNVAAPVGSIYTDTAATNGAIRWIKTSGTNNTGWRVEYGDTGWRDVTSLFSDIVESGVLRLRRVGDVIHVEVGWLKLTGVGSGDVFLPKGFTPNKNMALPLYSSSSLVTPIVIFRLSYTGRVTINIIDDRFSANDMSMIYTEDPWPTELPGTPA